MSIRLPALCAALTLLAACEQTRATRALEHQPSTEARGLVVHEWGTYTSLVGSNGQAMDGLHHVEETLPGFVHARAPERSDRKSIDALPEPVTQKLETPVLYFHGEVGLRARVNVGFPKGIISEWFPRATVFAPDVGAMRRLAGGSMQWDVELIDAANARPPVVDPRGVWAPSRRVDASGLRVGAEDERFIFYRGLGRFTVPFVTVAKGRGELQLRNDSDARIPAAFVLHVTETGGAILAAGDVTARGARAAKIPEVTLPHAAYVDGASTMLRRALEDSGLYPDEAQAMVDTWRHSYFLLPGVRVLYVAPRSWTDALLPIEIEPAPTSLVRTLVGRVEVMTPEEEDAIVARLTEAAAGRSRVAPDTYGRFTEPKLRRALQLIPDPAVRRYTEGVVRAAAVAP